MTEVKAQLSNHRQSPRKVRLVADSVRGKKISDAITLLSFTTKRSALPLKKLLSSALANAKSRSVSADSLVIKKISVDSGPTLFRRQPRSRGMANPIRKRTSRILVVLTDDIPPTTNKKKSEKVVGSKLSVVS